MVMFSEMAKAGFHLRAVSIPLVTGGLGECLLRPDWKVVVMVHFWVSSDSIFCGLPRQGMCQENDVRRDGPCHTLTTSFLSWRGEAVEIFKECTAGSGHLSGDGYADMLWRKRTLSIVIRPSR